MESLVLLCIWSILSLIFMTSIVAATDTISANQTIKDGEKIVSASGIFEVGFFRPRGSTSNRRYLGIWYAFSKETVVWVANREVPLNDTSGVLQFEGQGMLVIRDSSNFAVWSSTNSSKQGQNPIAQILDTGNLVVREADDTNEENYLWQSFDHLCNTMLPSVKYGKNLVTGIDNYLVSWKSDSDPSLGDTINRIDTNGYPQIFMSVGETIVFRSGPWNGLSFGGVNNLKPNPIFSYQLIYNDKEIDYRYDLIDKSIISRFVISDPGVVQRFNWNTSTKMWSLYLSLHIDKCDIFGTCGAFGSCNLNNSPLCHCLNGFVPKFPHEWESGNWSGGCTRKNKLVCEAGQTFQRIDGVKLPDTRTSWFNRTMNLLECEKECLNNCSCTAYSTLDISSGTGCLLWSGELLDIREYSGNGQTFYLRLPSTDSDQTNTSGSSFDKKLIGAIVIPVLITAIVLVVLLFFIRNKRRRKQDKLLTIPGIIRTMHNNDFDKEKGEEDLELPVFDLSAIAKATNDFSNNNKLGEGGFGPVYKGTLNDGQEIAVKRLSKSSGQGMLEFKNEVVLIAKLQHRNLVKLLGCCIEEEEKMLIYEFMPNKSLDYFIFDRSGRKLLDWSKRMVIIEGIARGLLYLHQDSRLRVIHRDLKASNVLLDDDMNPKISDFGMARMFRGDQYMANTKNVVGTYGYMSPEYAVDGVFSTKSDVFSFGVLVLEIVNGKRNRAFNHPDHSHNLVGHAWKLWMDKRPLELLDSAMDDCLIEFEIIRCIHVGLLCVQQRPEDRPNMSSVVLMLGSENMLPQPKQPGFFTERNMPDSECSSSNVDSVSKNEITITLLEAR